jgi:hypothetical protein
MLAISIMGATPRAVFYVIAVALFILAGIGFKGASSRVHWIGLGLAAAFFPVMWDAIAGV